MDVCLHETKLTEVGLMSQYGKVNVFTMKLWSHDVNLSQVLINKKLDFFKKI